MSKKAKAQVGGGAPKRRWYARDEGKEGYWRKHARAWRTSGLNKRGYCTQHDLPYWSFLSWLRKIELWEREENQLGEVATVPRDAVAQDASPFVPIRIISDKVTQSAERSSPVASMVVRQPVEIELPNGAVIRLHDGCDPDFVARLLTSVKV